MKTGQQLSREFDATCGGDHELLWEIFRDVQSSYALALEGADIDAHVRTAIFREVEDYLANHYGEEYASEEGA